MELVNDFTVSVPVEEAWPTLTDVERIAPCLPGAQLQEVEGDVYRGIVKVKVGPILAQFKGQATFIEKDDVNHKAVLKAEGRDTGGKGNASALITAQLEPRGDAATKVTVTTDLTITGKVAQFGRGALADVSTKLLNQFVDDLEKTVLTPAKAVEGQPRGRSRRFGRDLWQRRIGRARRHRVRDGRQCVGRDRSRRSAHRAGGQRAGRSHGRGRWRAGEAAGADRHPGPAGAADRRAPQAPRRLSRPWPPAAASP